MKIECPSCHLSGNVDELALPAEGRYIDCPRCKSGFHVAKPAKDPGSSYLMNACPACQYSTFSEEMFAVCPKCGMTGKVFQEKRRKQEELDRQRRDQETLHQSFRNPDMVTSAPGESPAESMVASKPIRITGWICIAVGLALLSYGIVGLVGYYDKDWQTLLSESLLEPLSKTNVFFRFGFLPWLTTLYSVSFIVVASQFLVMRSWACRGLIQCAWAGLGVGVINESAGFINWVRISSSTPSFSYYAVGALSSLVMVALWGAPFLVLLRFLQSDKIQEEYPEE